MIFTVFVSRYKERSLLGGRHRRSSASSRGRAEQDVRSLVAHGRHGSSCPPRVSEAQLQDGEEHLAPNSQGFGEASE